MKDTDQFPTITAGLLINGFSEWYRANFEIVRNLFTKEAEELFDTLEDFAIEIFYDIRIGNA